MRKTVSGTTGAPESTFRAPQPDYFRGPTQPDMWSWLEVSPQHVFRNSLITIISVVGFTFVGLASGTVVTETVFSLPGIGRLVVESVLRRDYPVIQGVILIIAVAYMVVNLLIDCCYTFLDPRIRVG